MFDDEDERDKCSKKVRRVQVCPSPARYVSGTRGKQRTGAIRRGEWAVSDAAKAEPSRERPACMRPACEVISKRHEI